MKDFPQEDLDFLLVGFKCCTKEELPAHSVSQGVFVWSYLQLA